MPFLTWQVKCRRRHLARGSLGIQFEKSSSAPDAEAIAWLTISGLYEIDQAVEQIRTALALGCDRGILVETDAQVEPLAVAKILQALVLKQEIGLVILGKQSIDTDNNQVGQMLAALLNWPQGTFACKAEFRDGKIDVTREIDGGEQTVRLSLPAIITTDLRLNEPRYASLPNIMKAKKKPIDTVTAAELEVDITSKLETLNIAAPPERSAGIIVESVAELVNKLKTEAKVI